MGLLHLKAGEYSVSLSYSVLRTDKYHNVRVRVPLLPEIGKTPILADFYVVSIFLNSVAIRTYFFRQCDWYITIDTSSSLFREGITVIPYDVIITNGIPY